jgi:hypothetical protein
MRRHGFRPLAVLLLLSCMGPIAPAHAQDVDALRSEMQALREQLATMTQSYEQRLKALSDRVEQLQRERPAPPAAATAPPTAMPAPAPTTPSAAASAPAPPVAPPTPAGAPPAPGAPPAVAATAKSDGPSLAEVVTPRQPFALSAPGRVLLFDLGVSGDFVTDFTSPTRERRQDGTFAGRENRLFPREIEVGFFGRVDPYASAVVRISAGEEVEAGARDVSVRLDEANVTLLTLPLGTTARFGLMRPRFGTLNSVHQDDLPQVDRPNVLTRFFGEEELDGEAGVEAFWVLPLPIYNEIAVGVFDGDNDVAFGRGSLRDPLLTARWRTFFEFDEAGGLQLDASVASGVTADERRNTVLGLGAKYKWMGAGSGFPVVTLAGEALLGLRRVGDDLAVGGDHRLDRWGGYLYAQYDLDRRWAAGLRGDWTELPTARGHEWALSPYLQFKPSEFLRFRVQYKHTVGTGAVERVADEVFLQGTFILGAHPTERF